MFVSTDDYNHSSLNWIPSLNWVLISSITHLIKSRYFDMCSRELIHQEELRVSVDVLECLIVVVPRASVLEVHWFEEGGCLALVGLL